MIKFVNKMKNNKGSAETVLFVSGMLVFTVIVVFCLNIFDLTWQRYVVTREVGNASRVYAIKWTEFYIKSNCNGGFATCSTLAKDSELGKNLMEVVALAVTEGNLDSAELVISTNPDSTCNSAGTLLCIKANSDGSKSLSSPGWDIARQVRYGDRLYSSMDVKYTWDRTLKTPRKQDGYRISNKFASETQGRISDIIG